MNYLAGTPPAGPSSPAHTGAAQPRPISPDAEDAVKANPGAAHTAGGC